MTDKKDVPGQKPGAAKPGDRSSPEAGGAKRPFATIDAKAVEIAPAAAKPTAAPKAAEPSAPKAPPAAMPRNQADAAAKVAAAAAAQRSGPSPAATAKPAAAAAGSAAASAEPPRAPSPPPRPVPPGASSSPSGGSFLSHALAGLVGAVVALAGTYALAPALNDVGLSLPSAPVSRDLSTRLAGMERKLTELAAPPADPAKDPSRANTAAAENARQITALQQQLAALVDANTRTGKLAGDLEARLSKAPPIADVGERLVTLEQLLNDLAKAAREEPDRSGRIPQLAQFTGRIAEMEAALATRIAEMRKDAARDVEARLAPVAEASEVARTTAWRTDRDVAGLKTETNRIATGLEEVKTGTERLQLGLKAARDEGAQLATTIDGLRRDVETRLKATAKPEDVSAAVAPIASQVASLQQNLTTVVKSEGERNATAERIVLSLELGNLKRAMERGAPYARELADVAKVGGARIDIAPLERFQNEGVATIGELTRSFRPIANAILDAEAEKTDGTVVDRLLSGAKTFVRVRKTTHASTDTSPEAIVARIEEGLRQGRLGDVLTDAKLIERKPDAFKDWVAKVEARQTVDGALKKIDEQLKASLGAAAAPAAAPGEKKGTP